MTTTITVPTEAGKVEFFTLEFPMSNFDEVIERASEITKTSEVTDGEEKGIWTVK